MSIESLGEFDENFGLPFSESLSLVKASYHEAIFSQASCACSFKRQAVAYSNLAETEAKVQRVARTERKEISFMSGGSGSCEVEIEWGGKDGVQASAHGKGEIHNSRGDRVEIEAKQNTDGTGSVSVSMGHERD
ncbi:MAG: hypothetical protein HY861_03600 [Chlamydiia bacterium]|nr:hypothetical protein [Chlamydiia bacterium]